MTKGMTRPKNLQVVKVSGETGAQWNTGYSGTFRVTYLFCCV